MTVCTLQEMKLLVYTNVVNVTKSVQIRKTLKCSLITMELNVHEKRQSSLKGTYSVLSMEMCDYISKFTNICLLRQYHNVNMYENKLTKSLSS